MNAICTGAVSAGGKEPSPANEQAGRKRDSAEEIPVVGRLAIVYLTLPALIWLVGWHQWWIGIPVTLMVCLALWRPLSGSWRVPAGSLGLVLLLVAAGWVMMSAAGGVFDVHNPEWHKHRAIFLDLSRFDWPVYLPHWTPDLAAYVAEDPGQPGSLLRYYLGYYIVPGLLGKWFGQGALNLAVPLWTWLGAALILLMVTRGFAGWKALAAAVVFLAFSGMDIVTVLIFEGWEWFVLRTNLAGWPQVWLGRILLERELHEDVKVLFHSHMYGMLWVPQHFIPGALYALLLFKMRRHGGFLAVSGIVVASALFWSPFVAVGLLPLAAALVVGKGIRPLLTWQNLLVSLPVVFLLVTYLTAGTQEVPSSWLWEIYNWRIIGRILPAVYFTEFLLLAALIVVLRPNALREPFFIASLATLLVLPLYYFGLHNDLVLRGLIPALVLLCCITSESVLGGRRGSEQVGRTSRHFVCSGLIVAVLGIGAVSPLFELARANNEHNFSVARYADMAPYRSILQIPWVAPAVHYQYIAQQAPGWYPRLLRATNNAVGPVARGEALVSATYTVYWDDGRLVYVNESCDATEVDSRFFLQIVPVATALLPAGRSHFSYDFAFKGYGWRIDETCLAVVGLPDIAIGHLMTGQLNAERTGHSWLRHHYSAAYRYRLLAEAGAPLVQSVFEVYQHLENTESGQGEFGLRRLLFSKDGCSQEDADGQFFVEVTPIDIRDLPNERVNSGYDVLRFAFNDFGGMSGGSCFAAFELPDYGILEIRVGQLGPTGEVVWEGRHAFLD